MQKPSHSEKLPNHEHKTKEGETHNVAQETKPHDVMKKRMDPIATH